MIWHWVKLAQHWLSIHLGFANETSVYYAAWSGFMSDLGELTIIGSIVMAYRHMCCASCPRIAKHKVGETGVRTCHKHATPEHHDRLTEKHKSKYPDHIAHRTNV